MKREEPYHEKPKTACQMVQEEDVEHHFDHLYEGHVEVEFLYDS
jgi:hypothetical protein